MAWTPPSVSDSILQLGGYGSEAELSAENVPGITIKYQATGITGAMYNNEKHVSSLQVSGGSTFPLVRSGQYTCGIPDGETIVLTGGAGHNYVIR